jgi:hypothetical protein
MNQKARVEKLELQSQPERRRVLAINDPEARPAGYYVEGTHYEDRDALQAAYPGAELVIIRVVYEESAPKAL